MTNRSIFILLLALTAPLGAQTPRALTAADYDRAVKFLGANVTPLVYNVNITPRWLEDDTFWYRRTSETGSEFVLVDPARDSKRPAFDHAKLAAALSKAAGQSYDGKRLPFTDFEFSDERSAISFTVGRQRWRCVLDGECERAVRAEGAPPAAEEGMPPFARGAGQRNEILSPDKKKAAFIRDYNLWVRDVETKKETQLTTDGIKDYGYATDNAGWRSSDRPVLLWSPDSKKIATFQQDQRKVGEMYLVSTKVGHPELRAWKYPLPGDENVAMIERVIIEVDGPKVIRLKLPPDQHRSTLCDDIVCRGGEWADVQWSPDSVHLAFVSSSRDHKVATLKVAEASSGDIRTILEEKTSTYYESGNGRVNWHYLPKTNEVIWFSERDNWGHIYLYDLETGQLKNRITSGEGNVTQVLRVDEKARQIYFLGVGREKGRDPYYSHYYKVGFDGKGLKLLTPENANHAVTLSPSGKIFFDSYSTPDTPQVSLVRNEEGKQLTSIEKADISKLLATGWKPPMQFTVKARDGETDLYGLLFRPSDFDPSKKYPIINNIYPGPQTGSVGGRSFNPARGDAAAIAELGFIVVQIDGMGTPWRSKKFHDAYFGNMGDNTLPDQVAGMKQLAAKYPWIDIDKAGIYGHSGGGYATAGAMFHFPDFFKVGVSQAGNHDNRSYEDDWAEKWSGLLQKNADGTSNYDSQANQNFAKNLKGKLLLAHGTMDNNVPPYNTLLVVNELIRHNKDFDLILFPNRGHGFGSEPYMIRRRWDYFVKHLMGAEPPAGYVIKLPEGPGGPGRGGQQQALPTSSAQ